MSYSNRLYFVRLGFGPELNDELLCEYQELWLRCLLAFRYRF